MAWWTGGQLAIVAGDRSALPVRRGRIDSAAVDRDFWMARSAEERVIAAWELSRDLWRMIGKFPDEPGLCRSLARIHRR